MHAAVTFKPLLHAGQYHAGFSQPNSNVLPVRTLQARQLHRQQVQGVQQVMQLPQFSRHWDWQHQGKLGWCRPCQLLLLQILLKAFQMQITPLVMRCGVPGGRYDEFLYERDSSSKVVTLAAVCNPYVDKL